MPRISWYDITHKLALGRVKGSSAERKRRKKARQKNLPAWKRKQQVPFREKVKVGAIKGATMGGLQAIDTQSTRLNRHLQGSTAISVLNQLQKERRRKMEDIRESMGTVAWKHAKKPLLRTKTGTKAVKGVNRAMAYGRLRRIKHAAAARKNPLGTAVADAFKNAAKDTTIKIVSDNMAARSRRKSMKREMEANPHYELQVMRMKADRRRGKGAWDPKYGLVGEAIDAMMETYNHPMTRNAAAGGHGSHNALVSLLKGADPKKVQATGNVKTKWNLQRRTQTGTTKARRESAMNLDTIILDTADSICEMTKPLSPKQKFARAEIRRAKKDLDHASYRTGHRIGKAISNDPRFQKGVRTVAKAIPLHRRAEVKKAVGKWAKKHAARAKRRGITESPVMFGSVVRQVLASGTGKAVGQAAAEAAGRGAVNFTFNKLNQRSQRKHAKKMRQYEGYAAIAKPLLQAAGRGAAATAGSQAASKVMNRPSKASRGRQAESLIYSDDVQEVAFLAPIAAAAGRMAATALAGKAVKKVTGGGKPKATGRMSEGVSPKNLSPVELNPITNVRDVLTLKRNRRYAQAQARVHLDREKINRGQKKKEESIDEGLRRRVWLAKDAAGEAVGSVKGTIKKVKAHRRGKKIAKLWKKYDREDRPAGVKRNIRHSRHKREMAWRSQPPAVRAKMDHPNPFQGLGLKDKNKYRKGTNRKINTASLKSLDARSVASVLRNQQKRAKHVLHATKQLRRGVSEDSYVPGVRSARSHLSKKPSKRFLVHEGKVFHSKEEKEARKAYAKANQGAVSKAAGKAAKGSYDWMVAGDDSTQLKKLAGVAAVALGARHIYKKRKSNTKYQKKRAAHHRKRHNQAVANIRWKQAHAQADDDWETAYGEA